MILYEDYLPSIAYEGKTAHAEKGFVAFQDEKSSLYYFALLDAEGKVLLKSYGHPHSTLRENALQSVVRQRGNKAYYSIQSRKEGGYYWSLRATDNEEIARSRSVDSEQAAQNLLAVMTGASLLLPTAAPQKDRRMYKDEDDYLHIREYAGRVPSEPSLYTGLVPFKHNNGRFYFAWCDDKGNVLMRSEGYPTAAARDNIMAMLARNRDLEERYAIITKLNRYFTILKAGNHQEIARSNAFPTELAAKSLFPSVRKAASPTPTSLETSAEKAVLPTGDSPVVAFQALSDVPNDPNDDDDYLKVKEYEGHIEKSSYMGLVPFRHANGKYYFVWYDAEGKVLMRSESYPTAAARDTDMIMVHKNRDIEERFSIMERMGYYFTLLRAANRQEIARSAAMRTEAEARSLYPSMRNPLPPVVATEPTMVKTMDAADDDDYLASKEYEHQSDFHPKYEGFVIFKHPRTRSYYFALLDMQTGKVLLRSEGYPNEATRENDIASVLRNRDIKERYVHKRLPVTGHHYLSLQNGNKQEIARTPIYATEEDLWANWAGLSPTQSAAGLAGAITQGAVSDIHATTIDLAPATPAMEAPVTVLLPKDRGIGGLQEIEINDSPQLEPPQVITEPTAPIGMALGNELSSSTKDVAVDVAASTQTTPLKENVQDSTVVAVPTPSRSWNGWVAVMALSFLVLGGVLYKIWENRSLELSSQAHNNVAVLPKSVVQPGAGVRVPSVTNPIQENAIPKEYQQKTIPKGAATTIDPQTTNAVGSLAEAYLESKGAGSKGSASTSAPVPKTTPATGKLHWLLFDFDKSDLRNESKLELDKLVAILKKEPKAKAELRGHTDFIGGENYNLFLSERRTELAKEYLMSKGIPAERILIKTYGKANPYAHNKSENNRQLNRRVEIRAIDAAGNSIEGSVPPRLTAE